MKRISLNCMDVLEAMAFKEELEESVGAVRVFIHPSCWPLSCNGSQKAEKHVQPLDFLKRILTTTPQKRTPIVIFEDQCNMYDFKRFLEDVTLKRNIYMVDTKDEDPEPKEGWQKCIDLCHCLGIKKMIIGGMYFYEYTEPTRMKHALPPVLKGCVYGAALELSQHFEIKISHFVNPGPASLYTKYHGKFSPSDHITKIIIEA